MIEDLYKILKDKEIDRNVKVVIAKLIREYRDCLERNNEDTEQLEALDTQTDFLRLIEKVLEVEDDE